MGVQLRSGELAFLYDMDTGRIVGLKSPDGSEMLLMRIPYIGSFYDLTDQSAEINTATAMTFNTTAISSGVSIVANSRVTVARKAAYNLAFSAQFSNASTTDEATVSIWLAKNNAPLAATNSDITIPKKHGGGDGKLVAAWNFFVDANEGDYFELYWSTTLAGATITHQAAQTSPVRPVTPSIILTVNEVDGSYP